MCLFESVPPNTNKPLISRQGAELQRGCCAGGAGLGSDILSRRSEPGKKSIFPPKPFDLAGEERSSRFKPGLILPLSKESEPEHGRCCRVCYPSIITSLISAAHRAAAEREPALPALRCAAEAKRAALAPGSTFSFLFCLLFVWHPPCPLLSAHPGSPPGVGKRPKAEVLTRGDQRAAERGEEETPRVSLRAHFLRGGFYCTRKEF